MPVVNAFRCLPAFGVAAGDKAEIDGAIDAWLAQHDAMFARPQADAPDAWNHERLEYAFSISGAFDNEETPLTATQYAEGHLDWHSVDVDFEINLGRPPGQGIRPRSSAPSFPRRSASAARPRDASGRWRIPPSTTACCPPAPATSRICC